MDLSGAQGELPIPMHATSPYGGIGGHVALHHEHAHHHPMNGPSPPQPQHAHPLPSPAGGAVEESKKRAGAGSIGGGGGGGAVKYRECLKNHAAAIGGNATDGCGEFMPSGEEGSLDALKCSACGCHRNFHRKELDGGGDAAASSCDCGHLKGRRLIGPLSPMAHKGLLLAAPAGDPFGFAAARALPQPPGHLHHHHMVMPLSAMQTSESDEMDAVGGSCARPLMAMAKKRFRTKFTPEQKEKMLGFAEKVGWRLQKLEDGVVQQFCQEIGVKRRVLKVWMHNNKHNLAKKPHHPPPPPGMPGCRSPSPPPLQLE